MSWNTYKISDSDVVVGFFFSPILTPLQEFEPRKPNEQSDDLIVKNISTMPAPKKLIQASSNGIPPPPPRTLGALPPPPLQRTMPPPPPQRTMPPPPPKFSDPPEVKIQDKSKNLRKTKSDAVPETLVKLMEYGDDDDDDDLDNSSEEPLARTTQAIGVQKPFWAL